MERLTEGMTAPDFLLVDAEGATWRLADLRGRRVVLYFYPADDTPGCTVEACDFRDSMSAWQEAGYVVLGVSPQGPDSKRAFARSYALNFPLLIDAEGRAQRAYGAEPDVPLADGIVPLPKRSTFVIDENGVIVAALYGVHAAGHVADLRARLGV